ncbi:hypothetical protein pb186bvf_017251 [Paramecium bursaria]
MLNTSHTQSSRAHLNQNESEPSEVIFQEICVLFLDFLKNNEFSQCVQVGRKTLKKIKITSAILGVYKLVMGIVGIFYVIPRAFMYGLLTQGGFYLYVYYVFDSEEQCIFKKSSQSRIVVMRGLIKEIQRTQDQYRIRLYKIDREIAKYLKYQLIAIMIRKEIGIFLYLLISQIIHIYIFIEYFWRIISSSRDLIQAEFCLILFDLPVFFLSFCGIISIILFICFGLIYFGTHLLVVIINLQKNYQNGLIKSFKQALDLISCNYQKPLMIVLFAYKKINQQLYSVGMNFIVIVLIYGSINQTSAQFVGIRYDFNNIYSRENLISMRRKKQKKINNI